MRLTLRTLLAYLDDTLAASEIKGIGQKVAESPDAQELIARIKQVTRHRRLTTPPATGPNPRFDVNDVAEYLDSELPSEQVKELEKVCLESDVHLAEVASCHQILTLVLGEPALVPPTARERMYRLVQGRESIPFRKAPAQAQPGAHGDDELGLPFLRPRSLLRWVLPVAGLLLFVALGVAVWQVLPERPGSRADSRRTDPGTNTQNPTARPQPSDTDKGKDGKQDGSGTSTPSDRGKPDAHPGEPGPPEPVNPDTPVAQRPAPPSMEPAPLARYQGVPEKRPSILVRRDPEGGWRRIPVGQKVSSAEQFVSLPGYASELLTDSGVSVLLRGHVREFSLNPLMDFLMESAVVLHKNPAFDLDLTLDRGRVYLANHKAKGPAKVRLRFVEEVWDLTLQEPGAEVGVDLFKQYTRDSNWRDPKEEPQAALYLTVLKGEAELKVNYQSYSLAEPPGPALFQWDSANGPARGPGRLPTVPAIWAKNLPRETEFAKEMGLALEDLDLRLKSKTREKAVDFALEEGFKKEARSPRLLALYCLAAVDEVGKLVDVLEDSDPTHNFDRDAAIFALRRWINRSAAQGKHLFDEKTKTGVLTYKKYRIPEADQIFTLLHDFSVAAGTSPETFETLAAYLPSKRVAIADLAYWHLQRLAAPVKLPPFNAAWPAEDREKAATEVLEMVAKKKLPPPPPPEPERPPVKP